jgi:hypothetical protein
MTRHVLNGHQAEYIQHSMSHTACSPLGDSEMQRSTVEWIKVINIFS